MSFYENSDHSGNALDPDDKPKSVDELVAEDVREWEAMHGSPPSEETIRRRRAYHENQ